MQNFIFVDFVTFFPNSKRTINLHTNPNYSNAIRVHFEWPNELYVKNHSIHICTCKPISVRACKCKWSPNWTDCISDWVLSSKRDHFIRMKFHPKKWWQKSEKVLRFTHAIRDWSFFWLTWICCFFVDAVFRFRVAFDEGIMTSHNLTASHNFIQHKQAFKKTTFDQPHVGQYDLSV